eukprot:SAG11_NODE_11110_length_783_cov_0.729532_1_plen_170_part_01
MEMLTSEEAASSKTRIRLSKPTWTAGDKVEGWYQDHGWFPCKIVAVIEHDWLRPTKYKVDWADDDRKHRKLTDDLIRQIVKRRKSTAIRRITVGWKRVVLTAFKQLRENTGRNSFRVAEVADQIETPKLCRGQKPPMSAELFSTVTENWRVALASYFTNGKRFHKDLHRK